MFVPSKPWGHRGVGQTAEDDPPPIDSMPGSSTSSTADDTGTNQSDPNAAGPAVNTLINPSAPVDAGAQTGTTTTQQPSPATPASPSQTVLVDATPTTNLAPLLLAGAVAIGGYVVYRALKKKKARR